ncbi:MAG: serine/threonine protein kinase [Acidobacteria bacterium]|nr:serine/threonine protein kinase [Acidobacteriota bacterium]
MELLTLGGMLAQYRLFSILGRGGMGIVYLAHDTRLQRLVAVKVLAPDRVDGRSRERLRGEALILSRQNHPNVATVFDFGSQGDAHYLVMEYVPGATLDVLLKQSPFATERVAALGAQLARGLAAAHAADVVHRDIKPGNLRLTPDGRLKILDFGVATSPVAPDASDTTASGSRLLAGLAGTLRYMAPERLKGAAADPRSDIFSAGVVLYEMACGRQPFVEEQPIRLIDEMLNGRIPRPVTLNPRVDPALEVVILRALSRDPAARYAHASELAAALEPLAIGRRPRRDLTFRPAVDLLARWFGRLAGILTATVGRSSDRLWKIDDHPVERVKT